jgi:ribonuclease P protein component
MIPFGNRFHGHNSLNYVYKNGQVVRSHLVIIKVIANKHRSKSRFAVVISKKVLKSAVKRNFIRRRLYEYIRSKLIDINGVYDVVFIVLSSDLCTMAYHDLVEQLDQQFSQLGINK